VLEVLLRFNKRECMYEALVLNDGGMADAQPLPGTARRILRMAAKASLPQPPPIEPGEHGLFGNIAAPAKPAAKPKAGSRPVYKFEMPDGAP